MKIHNKFFFLCLTALSSLYAAEQTRTLTIVNNTADVMSLYWKRYDTQQPNTIHTNGIPEIKPHETMPIGLPIPHADNVHYCFFIEIPNAVPPLVMFKMGTDSKIQSHDTIEVKEATDAYNVIKKIGTNQSLLVALQKKQCCIEIPNAAWISNLLTEKIKVKYTTLTTTEKNTKLLKHIFRLK